MKGLLRKKIILAGAAAAVLVGAIFFCLLYNAGKLSGDGAYRDLLYQIKDGVVSRWTEEGIMEYLDDGWLTYVVVCRDQMETLERLKINYAYDGEHLIVSYKEDGSFQSMWRLGKGTHILEISPKASFLYIAVNKEEVPELVLKNMQRTEADSEYKGKYLSVLGDSISSYEGYIPREFYPEYKAGGDLQVRDMWWYQTAMYMGMNVCSINGSSGSGVMPKGDGSGGNEERCVNLHTAGYTPDLILVLLGANDFFRGCSKEEFRPEYLEMLRRMQERYPNAEIVLCAYYHPSEASIEIDEVNEVIESVGKETGLKVIRLDKCGIEERNPQEVYYDYDSRMGTGIHPNAEGQKLLSDYICRILTEG